MNDINNRIRQHETSVKQWKYQDLADELYNWHDKLNKKFFEDKLGPAVISFDKAGVRTLGHYVLEKNGIGVEDNININKVYLYRHLWETLRTLLHEMGHQYQKAFGKRGSGGYHNKDFQSMLTEFGIPCDSRGCSMDPIADPFRSFLKEHSVEISEESLDRPIKIEIKGKSKLKKYSCQCNPPINIRVADRRFAGKCNHCNEDFMPAEAYRKLNKPSKDSGSGEIPIDLSEDSKINFLIDKVDKKHKPVFDKYSIEEKRAIYKYLFSRNPKKFPPSLRSHLISLYNPMADRSKSFPDSLLRWCINTYTGCSHGCGYCYVNGYSQKTVDVAPHPKENFKNRLLKDIQELSSLGIPQGALHISNSSDSCQEYLEKTYKHTLYTIQVIKEHQSLFTSIVILTKNPQLLCDKDYLDILKQLSDKVTVQISCAFWREEARQFFEPNAPAIQSRLDGLKCLSQNNIYTNLRIDPLFPSSKINSVVRRHKPLPYYSIPEAQTKDDITQLVSFAKESGAKAIIASPLKVVVSKRAELAKSWFGELYKDAGGGSRTVKGGSWRLPEDYQKCLINSVSQVCEQEGVLFKHCMHDVLTRK